MREAASRDESARSVRRGETRLRKQVPLQGLVVIRGSLVGLNTPHIRQLIEEIFEDRGLPPPIIKYHFANDVDFYELARFCTSGRSLNRLLYKKARDGIHQYDELHFYVERESSRGPELGRHPLAQAFDERLRELLGLYEPRLLNDPSLLKRRAR